ncbi:MAG: phosphate signaling complex protein PhoU [Anaerolineales bacterium]|jgi:phosphate transport system protein
MNIEPRETMDRKIHRVLDDILILGSMVEQALLKSVDALKRQDLILAQRIYDGDIRVNTKRFDIENDVMVLIATQQPMARDLRILASTLEVASELERIGDYAKGIANICLMMGKEPPIKPLVDIPYMAKITTEMLRKALAAFVEANAETAREIPQEDDLVDGLYNQVFRELITYMIADPSTIDRANFLMWVAHNLERAADRVTNICERAIYVATGQMKEIKVSDDEQLKVQLIQPSTKYEP